MSLTQVIVISAIVSTLVLTASLGVFSHASANGNFKRMHSGYSHHDKMTHVKEMCEEGGKKKIEHLVSYVEERFEFNEAQSREWKRVSDTLYSEENTIIQVCDKLLTRENHETLPARMELMEAVTLTGLEAMQRIRPVIEKFYSTLDEKQKKTMDDLLSHRNHKNHI